MEEEEEGEDVALTQGKKKSKLEELLELPKAQVNSIYDLSDGQQPFSRRKLMNSSIAKQKLKRSILEAAADITHEFHGPYLSRLLMSDYTQSLLDSSYPASAFESVKKGFLFHLNSTGHYLILREHLRHAVSQIIQQCGLMVRPSGFQNQHEFQNFLHDIYIYLSDQLHDCLKETVSSEIEENGNNPACPLPTDFPEMSDRITNPEDLTHLHLLHFAEEAIFEGDLENCHRLHLQRICRNPSDPLCWLDFASMWSQRGDDRMAEIAIREALKLDPKCIHALLLAGIIAARHRDERSLSLIGSALELRPLSPEIYTLLAAAHRLLGNEINSKYFSLKARVLHLMLIGRDPGKAGVELKNFNFTLPQTPNPNPNSNQNPNSGQLLNPNGIGTGDSARGNESNNEEDGASPKSRLPTDSQSQRSGKGGKSRSRVKKISTVDPNLTTPKSGRKSKSKDNNKDKPKSGKKSKQKENEQTSATSNDQQQQQQQKERIDAIKNENDLFTRKQSVSAREALNTMGGTKVAKLSQEVIKPQYYDLPIDINEGNLHLMFLPPLNPSIQFTWDVTMGFNKGGSKVVIPISSSATVPGGGGGKQYSSQDSDKEMEEIYQAFVNNPPRISKPQNDYEILEENPASTSINDKDWNGDGESPRKKSRKRSGRKSKDNINPPPEESARSTKDKEKAKDKDKDKKTPRGKKGKNKQKQQVDRDQESEDLKSDKGDKNINDNNNGQNIRMWTSRQGSEYIWTAQLLLQLHAHDFLDGVLARELFYTEHRSIPFLYLLSMSLFNRKREGAALPFLEEAISLDPNNPYIWELKGHTQYALNEFEEAAQCYEKSIENAEPNHDMQLTYLRFGSLCTDNNQMKLAKMVLLKGVNLYPSLYMWLALGNISYRQEANYEEAEAAFAQANRLDNTNPVIWGQLALISLAQGNQALAEQCYKWAVRFGLKKGPLLDDIKALQEQQGFGDPSFPRVPNCIPHEYFLKRLGRQKPLDIYREALQTPESQVRRNRQDKMEETTRELELKRRIQNWKKKGTEPGRDDNERERDVQEDEEEEDEEEQEWQSPNMNPNVNDAVENSNKNVKPWNPDTEQRLPFSSNRKSQDKR